MSLNALTLLCSVAATLLMMTLAVRSWKNVGSIVPILAPMGALVRPRRLRALQHLRARLAHAGWRNPEHADAYLGAHLLFKLAGLGGLLLLVALPKLTPGRMLLALPVLAVGFRLAPRYVEMRAASRRRAIA